MQFEVQDVEWGLSVECDLSKRKKDRASNKSSVWQSRQQRVLVECSVEIFCRQSRQGDTLQCYSSQANSLELILWSLAKLSRHLTQQLFIYIWMPELYDITTDSSTRVQQLGSSNHDLARLLDQFSHTLQASVTTVFSVFFNANYWFFFLLKI